MQPVFFFFVLDHHFSARRSSLSPALQLRATECFAYLICSISSSHLIITSSHSARQASHHNHTDYSKAFQIFFVLECVCVKSLSKQRLSSSESSSHREPFKWMFGELWNYAKQDFLFCHSGGWALCLIVFVWQTSLSAVNPSVPNTRLKCLSLTCRSVLDSPKVPLYDTLY